LVSVTQQSLDLGETATVDAGSGRLFLDTDLSPVSPVTCTACQSVSSIIGYFFSGRDQYWAAGSLAESWFAAHPQLMLIPAQSSFSVLHAHCMEANHFLGVSNQGAEVR
jgi:hypothetical protein